MGQAGDIPGARERLVGLEPRVPSFFPPRAPSLIDRTEGEDAAASVPWGSGLLQTTEEEVQKMGQWPSVGAIRVSETGADWREAMRPPPWAFDSFLNAAQSGGEGEREGVEVDQDFEGQLRRAIVLGTPLKLEYLMQLEDFQGYDPAVLPKVEEYLQLVVAKSRAAIRDGSYPPDKVWSFLDYVTVRAAEKARNLPPYFLKSGSIEEQLKFDSDMIIKDGLAKVKSVPSSFPGASVEMKDLLEVDLLGLGPKGWLLYAPSAVSFVPGEKRTEDDLTKLVKGSLKTRQPIKKEDLKVIYPAVVDTKLEPLQMFINNQVGAKYDDAKTEWMTKITSEYKGYGDAFDEFVARTAAKESELYLKYSEELKDRLLSSDLTTYFDSISKSLFEDAKARIPTCDRYKDGSFDKTLCELFYQQTFPKHNSRRRLLYDPNNPSPSTAPGFMSITQLQAEPTAAAIKAKPILFDDLKPLADMYQRDPVPKKIEYTDAELQTFLRTEVVPFMAAMQRLADTYNSILAGGEHVCLLAECKDEKYLFEKLMSAKAVEGFYLLQPAAAYEKKVTPELVLYQDRLARQLYTEAKAYAEDFPKRPYLPKRPPQVPDLNALTALKQLDDLAKYLLDKLVSKVDVVASELQAFFKTALPKTLQILPSFYKEVRAAFEPVHEKLKGTDYGKAFDNFVAYEAAKMTREFRRYFDTATLVDEAVRSKYLKEVAASIVKDGEHRLPSIDRYDKDFDKKLYTLFQEAFKTGSVITASVSVPADCPLDDPLCTSVSQLPTVSFQDVKPAWATTAPDDWTHFLDKFAVPFFETLRLSGDKYYKDASEEKKKVFRDYLPTLAVDGYYLLINVARQHTSPDLGETPIRRRLMLQATPEHLSAMQKTTAEGADLYITQVQPPEVVTPPAALLTESEQLIVKMSKEAVEAAKQYGDAFVKLPLLPPLLPWGYLQPAIPKAPAALPFVPSYKPYGAASLVTEGESMVVFPTLRQMTPPSVGVPVYGGSSEAVNMVFVREYRAILYTREREVDLTDAWLRKFDEFKTLTREVTVYANSFLKAVAVKVYAKRPSFDGEQYSAYVDLVAMYAYGDLRKLIGHTREYSDLGSDEARRGIEDYIDNILYRTTEEPHTNVMWIRPELLGVSLYQLEEFKNPQYTDFEKLVKDTIIKEDIKSEDADKVIRAMPGPIVMPGDSEMGPDVFRDRATAFFDAIAKERSRLGADPKRRRLQAGRDPLAVVDHYLVRRTERALQALAVPMPAFVPGGIPASPPLSSPEAGAAAALKLLQEADIFSTQQGQPQPDMLIPGLDEGPPPMFAPPQASPLPGLLGPQQTGVPAPPPPPTPPVGPGPPPDPLSAMSPAGATPMAVPPAPGGLVMGPPTDALTPIETAFIVQFYLQPSSGAPQPPLGWAGPVPSKLDDFNWSGRKQELGQMVDAFVATVATKKAEYAAQYADDPMRVQTFNDWLYSRTLIEAGRVASFVQGESEGYIGTIAVQRFIKERADKVYNEGVQFMESWSTPLFSTSRLFYSQPDWQQVDNGPPALGLEVIAQSAAELGGTIQGLLPV
uniref:Uncharacterized protein n=1 Tax=Vitrella brassicaformis TaxID=1169539 RepID=A0A7S1NZW7_9ALVE